MFRGGKGTHNAYMDARVRQAADPLQRILKTARAALRVVTLFQSVQRELVALYLQLPQFSQVVRG